MHITDIASLADADHEFELPIDGAVAEPPQWEDHTRHGRAGVLVAISEGLDAAASGSVRQIGDMLQHVDNRGSTRGQAPGISSSLPGAVIGPTYSRNGGRSSNSLRRTLGARKRKRTGTNEATEPTALTNRSVTKAVRLLRELAAQPRSGTTVTTLAKAVGISRPTAFRLLHSLELTGLVDRVGNNYSLGCEMARLAAAPTRTPVWSPGRVRCYRNWRTS